MAALARGEAWAAEEVWERHAAGVRRFLARALGPRADVDDLTQETFLRVFSRIGGLREAAALREFVFTVAVNVLRSELRSRWVRRKVGLSENGSVPEVEGPNADPEARQALDRCYAILDKLGDKERAAFVLRYMEERTLEEVAELLGVGLSTAKRLLNKSTARLEKHIGSDTGLRTFFEQRHPVAGSSQDGGQSRNKKKSKPNVRG